jgi:ArsR family transcriptional regulator
LEVNTAVIALTALAQESRLRIFRLLVEAGEKGIAAGDIASALEIPAATLTFHLKELTHADLVSSKREGRSIRYALRVDAVRDLLTYLLHDCCGGQPDLCGIAIGNDCKKQAKKKRATRT